MRLEKLLAKRLETRLERAVSFGFKDSSQIFMSIILDLSVPLDGHPSGELQAYLATASESGASQAFLLATSDGSRVSYSVDMLTCAHEGLLFMEETFTQ